MIINELLNRIAKLKNALNELSEGKVPELNLDNFAAQSSTQSAFIDKDLQERKLGKDYAFSKSAGAKEYAEQIAVLRTHLSELKDAQVFLKKNNFVNTTQTEPLNLEAAERKARVRAQLTNWIIEILSEIKTTLAILQRQEREILAEKYNEQVRVTFQQLQEAMKIELPTKLEESICLQRYSSNIQKLKRNVSERIKEIMDDTSIILDNTEDKYSHALDLLGLLKARNSVEKYRDALKSLGLLSSNEGDKYSNACNALVLKARNRRDFLLKAQEALIKYQQVFKDDKDKGLYISTSKIPKDQLKTYLERDKEFDAFNKWLDDYYHRAKDTEVSTWSWLTEQAKYHTTFFTTAEADEDWYFLSTLINEKLTQISEELSIQLDEKAVVITPENLAENNLYSIHRQYQAVKKLEALENLEKQEKEHIDQWNKETIPAVQKAAKAKLFTQLSNAGNQQAIIENDIFTLDTKYKEIISKIGADLEAIIHCQNQAERASSDLSDAKQAIKAIDLESLFASSKGYREPSCNELEQKIDAQLDSQERTWSTEIAKLTGEVITIPEDLAHLKKITEKNLTFLKDQRVTLQEKRENLRKNTSVLQHLTFTELVIKSLQKQLTALKVEDSKGRQKLFTQIEKVKGLIDELELKEPFSFNNSTCLAKFNEVTALANLLNKAKIVYQLRLLTNAESSVSKLTEATKTLTVITDRERIQFASKIKEELGKISEAIQPIINSTDEPEVRDKKLTLEKKSATLRQLSMTLIPMFNDAEALLLDYHKLRERANKLTEEHTLLNLFELGRDISELDRKAKPLVATANEFSDIAFAKPIRDAVEQIKFIQGGLHQLKKDWLKEAKQNPGDFLCQLTREVEATYASLLKHHNNLPSLHFKKISEFYEEVLDFKMGILPRKLKELELKVNFASISDVNQQIISESKKKIDEYELQLQHFILSEVKKEYQALYKACQVYSQPHYNFYTKNKRQVLQAIEEFKQSKLFQAYEGCVTDPVKNSFEQERQVYERALDLFKDKVPNKNHLHERLEEAQGKTTSKYFGADNVLGIFDNYLQQRHATFWFRDFMSSIAAFTFGCLGWKTEAQQRKDYLDNLKLIYQSYKDDSGNYKNLLTMIDRGVSQFKPRAQDGDAAYNKALQSYLQKFKNELEIIHEQNADLELKPLSID